MNYTFHRKTEYDDIHDVGTFVHMLRQLARGLGYYGVQILKKLEAGDTRKSLRFLSTEQVG